MRPRSRRTLCCSVPTPAAWPATGAPLPSCGHRKGRAALGYGSDEHALGLLHLGAARQEQRVPERAPLPQIVHWLD